MAVVAPAVEKVIPSCDVVVIAIETDYELLVVAVVVVVAAAVEADDSYDVDGRSSFVGVMAANHVLLDPHFDFYYYY